MPCHAQIFPSRAESQLGTPFDCTEDAWFWFIAAQCARLEGARYRAASGAVARPCEPIDILRVVDRLYRHRLLQPDHLRVLRHYGLRFMPPDEGRPRERRAATLWAQALARLDVALVRRGIVRPHLAQAAHIMEVGHA